MSSKADLGRTRYGAAGAMSATVRWVRQRNDYESRCAVPGAAPPTCRSAKDELIFAACSMTRISLLGLSRTIAVLSYIECADAILGAIERRVVRPTHMTRACAYLISLSGMQD